MTFPRKFLIMPCQKLLRLYTYIRFIFKKNYGKMQGKQLEEKLKERAKKNER